MRGIQSTSKRWRLTMAGGLFLGALAAAAIAAAQAAVGPSDTCVSGFVWREAVPDDHVCVTPATREQAAADNRAAASRVAASGSSGSVPAAAGRGRFLGRADRRLDAAAIRVAPAQAPAAPRPHPDNDGSARRGFDENGEPYVEFTFPDGTVQREQRTGITVTPAGGSPQRFPLYRTYSDTQHPTPPALPADPALGRAWVGAHNDQLRLLIDALVKGSQSEMQRFSAGETKSAGADIFRQVEYRTTVLQTLTGR